MSELGDLYRTLQKVLDTLGEVNERLDEFEVKLDKVMETEANKAAPASVYDSSTMSKDITYEDLKQMNQEYKTAVQSLEEQTDEPFEFDLDFDSFK